MGKYESPKEMNSDSEKYQTRQPNFIYGRAGRNLAAAIIMSFFAGVLLLICTMVNLQLNIMLFCGIGAVILVLAVIGCLISAAEQYGWAKDAERDEILEKLDQINKNIERVYNMEYSISMQIHDGAHQEDEK